MRRITIELREQSTGSWTWGIRVRSSFPGDLLVRAAGLGRSHGRVARPKDEDEATTVEAAVYVAALAVMDLYNDIENHPALYGPEEPDPGESYIPGDAVADALLAKIDIAEARRYVADGLEQP